MSSPAGEWQAVGELARISDPGLADVALGGQLVLLVRLGDEVRAYQGLCPHQYARLSEGTLGGAEDWVGSWLQCPRHLARFALADGRCGTGWALPPLRRFATRIEGGRILLPDPLIALEG